MNEKTFKKSQDTGMNGFIGQLAPDEDNPIRVYVSPQPDEASGRKELEALYNKLDGPSWARQGRTNDQVWAVRNFLTGLGGKAILTILSHAKEEGKREAWQELEELPKCVEYNGKKYILRIKPIDGDMYRSGPLWQIRYLAGPKTMLGAEKAAFRDAIRLAKDRLSRLKHSPKE